MSPLTPFPWIDVVIILALIVLTGVFSMSELAIVSSRKPRLEALAKRGNKGADVAIELAANPGKLLSTAQIGITAISVLSGAYSGEALGGPMGERVALLGVAPKTAADVGFGLVIVLTTFVSLIVGELVPKQFALRSPEPIAAWAARPMKWLSRAAAPLVWLLDSTTALVFRALRLDRKNDAQVTAEELHLIVAEASKSGLIEESERAIISGVVRLADRPVREVMTPRTEIGWIDVEADAATITAMLGGLQHSRMLVARGSVDDIVGVIQARDLVSALASGREIRLAELMRPASVVPDQVDAMDVLEALRRADVPLALVQDEYGHLEGIVTPADLLSAIAGDFVSDQHADDEPAVVVRQDGSLLVAGWCAADALADRLGIDLPETRDYATVAGLALAEMRRLPKVGDGFEFEGHRFEIMDMDGRKIDKLLVTAR